jgi:23S rRNA C2498 (ribose-2'-O)-methylase RlmM
MKKYIFLVICIFTVCNSLLGQHLTYPELKSMLEKNSSMVESDVIKKKFQFVQTFKDENNCVVYSYSYNKELNSTNALYHFSYVTCNEGKNLSLVVFEFAALNVNLLSSFREAINNDGYQFLKTKQKGDFSKTEIYEKPGSQCQIYSQMTSDGFTWVKFYLITNSYLVTTK